jgi:hypothetical protein
MLKQNAYLATNQMLTPSCTILGKSCIPCDYLSFVGNVAPAYGFFYTPESQED